MKIRQATEADTDQLVAMGAKFYETTAYAAYADFDETSARFLAGLILSSGIFLIAENNDGAPVGMIGLLIVPFLFNQTKASAHEVMWWMDPKYRSGLAGLSLIRATMRECEARGIGYVEMKSLATSPPEVNKMYERLGFRLAESSYVKVS